MFSNGFPTPRVNNPSTQMSNDKCFISCHVAPDLAMSNELLRFSEWILMDVSELLQLFFTKINVFL